MKEKISKIDERKCFGPLNKGIVDETIKNDKGDKI